MSVRTDRHGTLLAGSGQWLDGGHLHGKTLHDMVHPDDHEVLDTVVSWVRQGRVCAYGFDLHVRGSLGWDPAQATASADETGMTFSFVPKLPDPTVEVIDLVLDERDVSVVLDEALAAFAEVDSLLYATVHFDADDDGRYRSVVATTGLDMFRRAIEAAVAAETACRWDDPFDSPNDATDDKRETRGERDAHRERDGDDERDPNEDRHGDSVRRWHVADMSDGVHLAGRRVGINAGHAEPIRSVDGGEVATMIVWTEHPGQVDDPVIANLIDRVRRCVTLAFHERGRLRALDRLGSHDTLTGLWNRQAFFAHLRAHKARRNCAVACIDVDDFRAVNEWHGHTVGDDLLNEIGRRLRLAMRPGDVLARVSADEFAILLADVRTSEVMSGIAERILATFASPFVVGGAPAEVRASVGFALAAPERGGVKLLDAAERAMLMAKDEERGGWVAA